MKLKSLLIVSDAKRPKYSEGTEIVLPVSDENMNEIGLGVRGIGEKSKSWDVSIIRWESKSAVLEITPLVETIIGEWSLTIETKSLTASGSPRYSSYTVPKSIYILFNPWHKGKPVNNN